MKPRLLMIEDDAAIADALKLVLESEDYDVRQVDHGDRGLEIGTREDFDAVLCDLRLPGLSGIDLVRQLHSVKPRLPILLMTAHGTAETAIEAMKLGAFDYLIKPPDMRELINSLAKAVSASRLMTEHVSLGSPASETETAIIGQSRAMQTIYKEVGVIAASSVPVLIRGETGTGKELIARAIYQYSPRAAKPFVAVNCAAVPEALLESELFGHEKGAFTGADQRRIGRFEQAGEGTIFLDEIGDLTLSTQVKLLRVLQEKVIQRVGGRETIPIDFRVIAATHRDLETAMREKQFREDLFYRLNVATVSLPALRDRAEDIPALVRYFLQKHGRESGLEKPTIEVRAMDFLQNQRWPGNVRELENVIRKTSLRARGFAISEEDVRSVLAGKETTPVMTARASLEDIVAELVGAGRRGEIDNARERLLETVERELFNQAIRAAGGNQARASRWVGVSRLTMREKLTQFKIPAGRDDASADSAPKAED
ncbi:MAG: sigma-54-dependent Fis family transcriptional regulator [Verrucomicrobia bacterium]|nr:sigma-54-dependent Fis family transcriptional regulator [Verrucomicrobiota bacterium]MBI3868603.1 sigma-54-dependent Fis family transcriptional regulator [Verrucomicrobiota bacterium]